MNKQNTNPSTSVATQTDTNPPISNIGQGRHPIDESKHAPLFEFETEHPLIIVVTSPGYSAENS